MPKPFHNHRTRFRLVALLLLAVPLAFCSGCWPSMKEQDSSASAPLVEEKSKDDEGSEDEEEREFEISPPIILPGGEVTAIPVVKPGHWAVASQEMTFNKYDFVGESTSRIIDSNLQNDIPVPSTPFTMRSSRPVVFSKGRPRKIETLLYIPGTPRPVQMATEIRERRSGTLVGDDQQQGLLRLAPSQYLIVVLAKDSQRYGFLQHANSVRVPFNGLEEFDNTITTLHYRVVYPEVEPQIPLADNPLAWTTIAYILWDEVDPSLLTLDQQEALVDWLQWGGQLIINGPNSLDLLNGSFLEPYLPANANGSRNIVAEDLKELSQGWMVRSAKAPQKPLVPVRPWSGVVLEPHPDAKSLPATGDLLVERDIGRGRIVVSAMHLSERELINWNPHFQSWLNACVLRRGPRKFHTGITASETLLWADDHDGSKRFEARRVSNLRYFVRDSEVDTNYIAEVTEPGADINSAPIVVTPAQGSIGGVAAWNDFSGPATAATKALREAAGVEIPERSFVVACVLGYLLVLVPLNWLFFRAIGRVEWAWIAAPLIAVAHTFIVVNRAQLDIGFVRAQTEIGVLELQPGHARGHLTRFTALYTSLATSYDLEFENRTALAAPLGDGNFRMRPGMARSMVDIHRHDVVKLSDVQVGSNSTSLVHSEQMLELAGPIQIGKSSRGHQQIENRSQKDLYNVGIVRRAVPKPGQNSNTPLFEGTWIGNLASRESRPLVLFPILVSKDEIPFAKDREQEITTKDESPLNLDNLLLLAYGLEEMQPGETRLVGQIDEMFPGETIQPTASQLLAANIVVAHLTYGPRPRPLPDVNAPHDVVDNWVDEYENELELKPTP